MKNNKGFSLLELIIVVAIMVVLMTILAPQLTKYIGKTKRTIDADTAAAIVRIFEYEAVFDAKTGVPNGWTNYMIHWKGTDTIPNINPTGSILDTMFRMYGKVPSSKYNKDFVWILAMNKEKVKRIYLAESVMDDYGYEIYPDASLYINHMQKKRMIIEYN